MPITYKIKTINDIVTKIPSEALPRFLNEFPAVIAAVAMTYAGYLEVVPENKMDLVLENDFIPVLEWIDD